MTFHFNVLTLQWCGKAKVGKSGGILAQIKTTTQNCMSSYAFNTMQKWWKKMQILTKNILDEQVNIFILWNLNPWVYIFLTLCKIWEIHTCHYIIKCNGCLTGNLYEDMCAYVFEPKVSTVFHETQFFERITDT